MMMKYLVYFSAEPFVNNNKKISVTVDRLFTKRANCWDDGRLSIQAEI